MSEDAPVNARKSRAHTPAALEGGKRRNYFRLRTAIYGVILIVMIAGLSVAVSSRNIVDIKFIRAIDTPYTKTTLADGSVQIINHYRVNLKNQGFDVQNVSLSVDAAAAAAGVELVAPTYPLDVEGGGIVKNSIFVKFPSELTRGSGKYAATIIITVTGETGETTLTDEISLIGPFS